jgi:hypothetical protein
VREVREIDYNAALLTSTSHSDSDTPSPDLLWSRFAAAIAAGGRVRVAHDGRSYRRSWETQLDPARRPALPAAVRTYDKAGETRCVAFDLDARKKASRGAVLRDCERLVGWLSAAGCSYLVDESVSGGRHVYVFLAEPASHADIAPLARRLRSSAALPTLDPGPLVNLSEGCIRPPGATHKAGGHQRLITPLPAALAAASSATTPASWRAFLASLPAPPVSRLEADLHEPAAEPAPAGLARPLAPAYAAIASTGRYDPGRYPSASEARAAVILHALCRGWTGQQIAAEVTGNRWPGLAGLYAAHYGTHYTAKALAGDLTRAQARYEELPLHRIHTSATRPRGGGGQAARTHLRKWAAALELAIRNDRWPTARSYGIELLLVALGDAARRSQTIYPAFGVRHLSMGAGTTLEPSTVAKLLKALAQEEDPFVLLVESDRGVDPDIYELRIPDAYLDQLPVEEQLPPPPYGVHPAFSFLPKPAYRLYSVLASQPGPASPADLATAARMPLRTVYAVLNELRQARLAQVRSGQWQRGRRNLSVYARARGAGRRLHDLIVKWRSERAALRAAHGLPDHHYPARFSVGWPGIPPPPPPPLSTEQLERAIGGGRPDWRTDLESAVLQMLQEQLGAQVIDPGERDTG